MIGYPYNQPEAFADWVNSGCCAIGGSVYHFDPNLKSEVKIPRYYDKALFIADWMRLGICRLAGRESLETKANNKKRCLVNTLTLVQ
jgi:hypothetical protein